ncbi:PREDICTED: uncharacterized protein LOC104589191 [Nelumbo nucifera]|uniref:Uncharacterized protein LOC104589191 n=1 Tax=Nelumbo nucifera TaxID=4432 RepID=A0A1U7Z4M0_NELNU|nr:PREDICTED: uncharacterized protein LOC104589191 [Nelumbo nucifera]
MRGDLTNRNPNKYCHFHYDIGHDTKSCRNLKDEIKELIHCGYLKQFIKRDDRSRIADQPREVSEFSNQDQDHPPQDPLPPERPIHGVINMITRGLIVVGCTSTAERNSIRELEHEDENPSKRHCMEEAIYFTKDDTRGIQYPHNDTLIVKMVINEFEVKQILVDSRSSADIIFMGSFEKMR